ncbi:unnamed protein product [Lymnaea stagnalis]|uniref:DNA-3-methyladenine glycosylase n=1 Tax=Lymnaea stagnalis TaxID=6523 RepID=A0AAV2IIU4_LYMST
MANFSGEPNRSKRRSENNGVEAKKKKNNALSIADETSHQTEDVNASNILALSRLSFHFFDVPCAQLARSLLGQILIRIQGSQRISGRIVETEAYLGLEDKAAHSFNGKRTERNEAMFMTPGTAYVYNIYGMYCCLNISSQGEGCAVLVRALEPVEGVHLMREHRGKNSTKPQKEKDMTNGPSKLCQAMAISKSEFNKIDVTTSKSLFLEQGSTVLDSDIVRCARVNIGYAEEWEHKPLRFYVLGNKCVSVRDKQAEQNMSGTGT